VWRQAALLLQASWASNEQQASRGLTANEEAERTRNRKSYAQLKGKQINLIAPENGGSILASSGVYMEQLVDGSDRSAIYSNNDFAVWGFKDKRSATFSQFTYSVPGSGASQFLVVELSHSNGAPAGPFTP
jgi:hypothetical protein